MFDDLSRKAEAVVGIGRGRHTRHAATSARRRQPDNADVQLANSGWRLIMTYDAQWFWIVIMHCLLFGTLAQAIAASGSENIAAPSSVPSAAEVPGLFVQQVRVLGNTVLSNKTIADIVAPFIGRFLTADDLETIRYRLTQAYISRGYVNSGVILPDQTVENGVVSYRAIEGKLTGIDITGTTWLSPDYVRSRLKRGVKSPSTHSTSSTASRLFCRIQTSRR